MEHMEHFGGASGPGSLEADKAHSERGSQEMGAVPMDTSDHSAKIPPSIPCTGGETEANRGKEVKNREEIVGFNSNLSCWGRFSSNYGISAAEVGNHRRISEKIKETFNEMLKYDVKEPVGCALLVGFRGPKGAKQLTGAVFQDVHNMKEALNKVGRWHTTCLGERDTVSKKTLYEKLNDALVHLDSRSIFLFYYSGHGNHDGVVLEDGHTLDYKSIVNKAAQLEANLNSLRNTRGAIKPKIFVFDTCRSERHSNKIKCSKEFPPPHTLVCFSTVEGCESAMDDNEGSFFTLALAHSISSLGWRYSFYEVVTYAGHIAQAVSENCQNIPRQLPVFLSTMDKILFLSANGVQEGASSPVEESFEPMEGLAEPVFKGGGFSHTRVEKDIVHLRDVKVKSEWKSKKQVVDSVRTLGDGISVFVIYAPNPDDPYQVSSDMEQRNKVLMLRLFFDLERHGFHVLSDVHLGDTEPKNWLKWYVSRILQCNYVLMVCSPAFKEIFQGNPREEKIVDIKARRLLEYSTAVYSQLDSSSSNDKSKFLPVILDSKYTKSDSVPALFAAGSVYKVKHEDQPRKFDYDNRERDFEKLVCCLAGLDRSSLDQPVKGQVRIVKNPYDVRAMELQMKHEETSRLLERPPGMLTADELTSPSNLASTSYSNPRPTHRSGASNQHGFQTFPPQGPAGPLCAPPHPQPQFDHQPLPPQPHPPVQQPRPQQTQQPPNPYSLPDKCPDRSIYLWLSGEILSWKFVARHLGLTDADIETIETDHHGVEEQRYQMFQMWERRGQECNYQKLGKVLFDSEKNRKLYPQYVEKVRAIGQF